MKQYHEKIYAIEKACNLTDKTFEYILTQITKGVSEKELALKIKLFIKKHKAKTSFPPIVAFGKNSAFPHHKPTYQKLAKGMQIKLDLGVKLSNYCSDMTRTVFFGSPDGEFMKMYQTVLEAQKLAIEYLNKDTPSRRSILGKNILARNIDKVARDYIISKGFPSIPHSLGHGIGLKVHEAPKISPKSEDVLKPGMVFTIEPGIYLPNIGGVRIEDVVVLEKSGLRIITKSPKEIIVI